VAQGRADDGAVQGHLRDARGEVGARLAPVVRNPRGQELLQAREGARRQDLGAQRVALQLLEICLRIARQRLSRHANCATLTAKYPLTPPPPLASAWLTSCIRSFLPLPAAPATAAAVAVTVSFSNLTDMTRQSCATVGCGWCGGVGARVKGRRCCDYLGLG
jgi:hypothetical protein